MIKACCIMSVQYNLLEYGQKHKPNNRKSARKDSNRCVLSPNAVDSVKEAVEELTMDNFYGPYDLILQSSAFLDAHTFIGNMGRILSELFICRTVASEQQRIFDLRLLAYTSIIHSECMHKNGKFAGDISICL